MRVSERYMHMNKFWHLAHCIQSPHQPWDIDEADIFTDGQLNNLATHLGDRNAANRYECLEYMK